MNLTPTNLTVSQFLDFTLKVCYYNIKSCERDYKIYEHRACFMSRQSYIHSPQTRSDSILLTLTSRTLTILTKKRPRFEVSVRRYRKIPLHIHMNNFRLGLDSTQ